MIKVVKLYTIATTTVNDATAVQISRIPKRLGATRPSNPLPVFGCCDIVSGRLTSNAIEVFEEILLEIDCPLDASKSIQGEP